MLKSLEFENFKSWGGRHRLELGRITGLFGANSSGKSSVIQLLLMLKQTVESTDSNVVINFGGGSSDYMDLGSFLDIVTGHNSLDSISYALNWTRFENPAIEMNLASTLKAIPGPKGEQVVVEHLHYNNHRRPSDIDRDTEWKDAEFVPVIFDGRYGKIVGPVAFTVARSASGKYDLDVRIQKNIVLKADHASSEYCPIGMHRFPLKTPLKIPDKESDLIRFFRSHDQKVVEDDKPVLLGFTLTEALIEMGNSFEELLGSIRYLGPLRDYPSRNYLWTGVTPATIGHRGELSIPVLLSGETVTPSAVSNWLLKLGIAQSFSLKPVDRGARIWEPLVRDWDTGTEVNLADVGFGVSQVLPVIVALLSAPPGSLVILEHPEIHLHPKAQSELADLLVEVASTGEVQILIESHSEHLLARIQRRISESSRGDGSLSPEDVRLYFCEQQKGQSKLTPLEMQASGVITNWPDDFFGDILEERMALSGFYPKSDDPVADG